MLHCIIYYVNLYIIVYHTSIFFFKPPNCFILFLVLPFYIFLHQVAQLQCGGPLCRAPSARWAGTAGADLPQPSGIAPGAPGARHAGLGGKPWRTGGSLVIFGQKYDEMSTYESIYFRTMFFQRC